VKIENRKGESLPEATVTLDDNELVDLLQGLADVIEDERRHLHFSQAGGPELVVRRSSEADTDPLRHQMDWWVGPAVLALVVLVILGAATFVRWAVGLL
jgi:hypothetical protein